MRTKPCLIASIIVAAVLAVAAGCSSSSDTATTTSSVVAKSSSGDDGGSDGGSSDGGSSDDAEPTESVDLPDDWPEELAMPDGLVVLTAANHPGGSGAVVVARVDGDPQDTLDAFEAQLTDADWEIVSSDFTDSPQGGFGAVSARGRQYTVAIAMGPDSTGDTTEVTISIAAKTST